MWEVEFSREHVNEAALHPLFVNVVSDHLADEVLPGAGPSVQGEHQGLLGVVVAHEAGHRFQDDARRDVLPEQLGFQVRLET